MIRRWTVLDEPPTAFLEEFPNLPPIVARLLYHRGLRTQEQIDEFMNPDYSTDVHDPYLFKDMSKAVERIFQALKNNEKIIIHGDYDADGVSAAVILTALFRALNYQNFDVFLPHRETDGYGLNKKNVQMFSAQGAKLLISCDCGISNIAEVDLANDLGVDVIITDHHSIPATLPKAYAIIHPKIGDETYPDKTLCGGAVAFKLMQAVLKKHAANQATLPNGERHETFAKWQLDMAAIASVADMVPLLGESRTLTKYGLIVLNKTKRVGLQKLLLESRLLQDDGTLKKAITADTIGWQIAPRINAAGRMNHANVAYKLLATDSPTEAVDLAFELDQNNRDRQALTEELVGDAKEQVERDQMNNPLLFVLGRGWPTGIVGLIAGKLKEKYQKPAIVMTENKGEITGSGRSVEGFNLIASLQTLPEQFGKFGGHPMACGFTLASPDHVASFKNRLLEKYHEKTKDLDLSPKLEIDAEIDLDRIDWELYDLLQKFEPFGQANPKPKYVTYAAAVISAEPLGQDGKHLKIMAKHKSNKVRKFVGWRMGNGEGTNWCEQLQAGDKIDIVYEVGINEWNGNRELQLTLVELRKAV